MNQELDLTECELEPLRTLGFIQSHGCLIAFGKDRRVQYISTNVVEFFEIDPHQILNRDLSQSCSPANWAKIEQLLPHITAGVVEHFKWDHPIRSQIAWLHFNGLFFILELEGHNPELELASKGADDLQEFLTLAQETNSIPLLAQLSADAFAHVSGYDRVMIYQFHEDWSGQVIAEHGKPDLEPYLGLRYPASDIPIQARHLYTRNLLRVVVDARTVPTPIVSDPIEAPLDLTHSILRAVSPYHIEYLLNMQVNATLTASLMVQGQLWGLLACHHSTTKPVVPRLRDVAHRLAGALSLRIDAIQTRTVERANAKVTRQLRALESELTEARQIVEGLCFGQNRLQALFEIDSAAIYTEDGSISIGNAPEAEWIESQARGVLGLDQDVISFSDSADAMAFPCEEAAGALAIVLNRNPGIVILCFRAEFSHELTWGGDVTRPAFKPSPSERVSPRKSFAAYKQTVRGKSLPWTKDDLARARGMAPILRRLLPEDRSQARSIIARCINELAVAIPGSSPLFRSLLEVVSEGMSLFIHNHTGSAAPAFASQALLNQFNLDDQGPEFSLSMADFFRNIGLPEDLLNRVHFGPREVQVMTGRCANRSYLVELKQILEVATKETSVSFSVLTFHNVTRYTQLIEATESARQQADHARDIKSAFLANMSHEVRTPLNGILGMAHLLGGMGLSPEQRELVGVIERSGEALLRLVNDILDVSKIEAGKLTLESVPMDLHELLQDALRLFQLTARPGVELRLELANDVPALLIGDPVRLRQVIMNLLGNAVKFTHEGSVILRVNREKTTSIYVTLNFEVIDSGIGIAADKIGTLFQRFSQADSSIARNYGGTGLGLAISQQLVTLMGGQIEAASTVGQGTTISFRLAFLVNVERAEEHLEQDVSGVQASASLKSLSDSCSAGAEPISIASTACRVLLVDDNVINRMVATALLTRYGYQVSVAEDGLQAVDLAQRNRYDAILMDCQMPGMDGYEATGLIRKREVGGERTPIIAVTANVMQEQRERCLAAGMDDFLSKPINPGSLEAVLKKWVHHVGPEC